MPSGAKKRKAAKKKKANDSSTANPLQGENENPSVEIVKREESSSETKSKDANEKESNIEIEKVSKSKSSNSSSSSSSDSSDDESHVVEKKVVVLESAQTESVPAIESLPESIPPTVEPVKPVDSLLEEVSQVFDEMKNEEIKDLVVEEAPVPVVEEEPVSKEDRPDSSVAVEPVLKEDEVEQLQPSIEPVASSEPTEYVSTSTPPKDLIPEANGADRANEIETTEHSDRQAAAASTTPVTVHNATTWKSCCGIFDLFSRSERN